MLFSHHTHLSFKGLKKIQSLLEDLYHQDSVDNTLVVTASIPSLNSTQKLQLIEEIRKYEKIIFWCYGDLLWNLSFFKDIESNLIKKKVTWVMASKRWAALGSRYIPENNISIIGHPFLVEETNMEREILRDQLSLAENEKLIIYAGRQAYSKNIPFILKIWDDLQKNSNDKIKLLIAGSSCRYQSFIELHHKIDYVPQPTSIHTFQSMHSDSIYIQDNLNDLDLANT